MAKKGSKKTEATLSKMEIIRKEIDALITEYNESAEFAEFKRMKKIKDDISEKVSKYAAEAKNECFAELKKDENPLLAAAKKLRYDVIKVQEKKLEEGGTKLVVNEDACVWFDPKDLHDSVNDGIGASKGWVGWLENLNCALAGRVGFEMGYSPEEIAELTHNFRVSKEAMKLEGLIYEDGSNGFDVVAADEHLRKNMQIAVDAMLGEGYEVTMYMVRLLLKVYNRFGKNPNELECANHSVFRKYMLRICNSLITGSRVYLKYVEKK